MKEVEMLAIYGVISIASGTCLTCTGTQTRYEKQSDVIGGLLLIAGLWMVGMMMPVTHI